MVLPSERSFLQRNGDIFAFDHSVDEKFMHGVYPVEEPGDPPAVFFHVLVLFIGDPSVWCFRKKTFWGGHPER